MTQYSVLEALAWMEGVVSESDVAVVLLHDVLQLHVTAEEAT